MPTRSRGPQPPCLVIQEVEQEKHELTSGRNYKHDRNFRIGITSITSFYPGVRSTEAETSRPKTEVYLR